MKQADRQKLRDAAMVAMISPEREGRYGTWELQTSNSFRRIGCHGDGDVLCAVTQRPDGHPDLLAARGVLDYVVAAQPRAVLNLLDQIEFLETKWREAVAAMGKLQDLIVATIEVEEAP